MARLDHNPCDCLLIIALAVFAQEGEGGFLCVNCGGARVVACPDHNPQFVYPIEEIVKWVREGYKVWKDADHDNCTSHVDA